MSDTLAPVSAVIDVGHTGIGNAFMSILLADDLQPGDEPSYNLCKLIYLHHPLGAKIVDEPIRAAQSQQRDVVIENAPDEVKDAFQNSWKEISADRLIANAAGSARRYGISSLIVGAKEVQSDQEIDPAKLWKMSLFFNVADPLNTAGSLVLNQDPNAADFQKHTNIVVQGKPYHRSRACVIQNEEPIYISYTSSAFGFVGRSAYTRVLFPLKSYIKTMITNDMVATKAGLLIAKMQGAGSIVNRAMQAFAGVKRMLLRQGKTNNVLSIGIEESIESINLQNVDKAGEWARTCIIKDIASGVPMPATMLLNETLTEGFGEGSEDAKIIARYIDSIREWLEPLYGFLTGIVQRRAWNPDFFALMQRRYPDEYEAMSYEAAFHQWTNRFHASWPSLLIEPDSELVKVDEVKFKTILAAVQIMAAMDLDPENKVRVLEFLEDNIGESRLLFPMPLRLDFDTLRNFATEQAERQIEQQEIAKMEGQEKQMGARMPKPFSSSA